RHIDKNARNWYRIGAGIDCAGDIRSVPVHDDRDVIPLGSAWPPVASPRAGQRVTFLCESQHGHAEARAKATEAEESSTHGPQYSPTATGAQREWMGASGLSRGGAVVFSLPHNFTSRGMGRIHCSHRSLSSK